MNFLDESGLKKLWSKIKASFGTVLVFSSKCEEDNNSGKIIPFITNHQFINIDSEVNNNVYSWFKKASKGGILEAVFTRIEGCSITCRDTNKSYLYKIALSRSHGPYMDNIDILNMGFQNYARLIKIDDNTLLVAEFVENKYSTSS